MRVHDNPHHLVHGIWVVQVLGSGDNSDHVGGHAVVDDSDVTADSVEIVRRSRSAGNLREIYLPFEAVSRGEHVISAEDRPAAEMATAVSLKRNLRDGKQLFISRRSLIFRGLVDIFKQLGKSIQFRFISIPLARNN